MSSSKVYFTNLRVKSLQNLFKKLDPLIINAGFGGVLKNLGNTEYELITI